MNKTEASEIVQNYGIDGVMIGRGIFHDPFLFNGGKTLADLSFEERTKLLIKHSQLFQEEWGESKHFEILRKFYKIYTLGLPNANKLRGKLMQTKSLDDVKNVIANEVKQSL